MTLKLEEHGKARVTSQLTQLRPLNALSLRDQIKEHIRDAILDAIFKPGEHLVEATIADQLGVSRAPVREALSALEREGIVVYAPRRGYFIVDFTDKDIEEIYSLRLLLETEALKRAIERITNQDIAELQHIVDELGKETHKRANPAKVVSLDLSFHERICRIADHGRLYSAWNSMKMQTWLLIGLTSRTHYEYPNQPKEFHQGILDALLQKDLSRAEANLTEHILDAQERAMRALWDLRSSTSDGRA